MILKNEIPILEFDTDETQVINPTHENLDIKLPKKAVFAFLDEHIERYAKEHNAIKVSEFTSETKNYPIYIVTQMSVCVKLFVKFSTNCYVFPVDFNDSLAHIKEGFVVRVKSRALAGQQIVCCAVQSFCEFYGR